MKTNSAIDFKLLAKRSYLYAKAFTLKKYSAAGVQYENAMPATSQHGASRKLYLKNSAFYSFPPFFGEGEGGETSLPL